MGQVFFWFVVGSFGVALVSIAVFMARVLARSIGAA